MLRPSLATGRRLGYLLTVFTAGLLHSSTAAQYELTTQTITLTDRAHQLVLHVRLDRGCALDQVKVMGRDVVASPSGVTTGVKVGGHWHTSADTVTQVPKVTASRGAVVVSDIVGGGGGVEFTETWRFTTLAQGIRWRIERQYLTGGEVDEVAMATWNFTDMATWTGALLGNGGVAWTKLFDRTNATYGVHAGDMTLWNRQDQTCLRVEPRLISGGQIATRFTRQADGRFTVSHCVSPDRLATKHELRRFLRDRQDVWAPWTVAPGKVIVEFDLQALDYHRAYDRGQMPGFNADAIREILNTIARIGAIDDDVMGSNGYYSGYAVLHEPWIAQLGLAIDDPAYFRAFAHTLDFQRDHAVGPDGRVKSRWSYDAGDAMPGSYDRHGFYECQWGWLMDSQPSYVINVAEQFDFSGDRRWLQEHKASCEKALEFLLRRDQDQDGLVEMATASHAAAKGSDWIDVIWAAHENAFVNAQMYQALRLWSEKEELLGDPSRAADYLRRAAQLKARFNAPVADGGFWHPGKECFVHWRDQDDSVHGDNLVVPVNFMAIGYDLCEPPERARAILRRIETQMQREGLFFWPLCLDSYQAGEGAAWQWPFPNYENGDLFLAWGELGTRAYARHEPQVALKYVRNVLAQYERDGLAFQRYQRKNQQGAGDDILANNCSPVVGLYRNIYGIQPKWNRLLVDPHLTPDLNGTRLRYWLRGQTYEIDLSTSAYRIAVENSSVNAATPFGVSSEPERVAYFHGSESTPSLTVRRPRDARLDLNIQRWSDSAEVARAWTLSGADRSARVTQEIAGLTPVTTFRLAQGNKETTVVSDTRGRVRLGTRLESGRSTAFQLSPRSR